MVLVVHVSAWVVWQMEEYSCVFVLPFKFLLHLNKHIVC